MRAASVFAAVIALGLAGAMPARAAPPRLVEAWAEAPVDLKAPMRIVPGNPGQANDPLYHQIASQLGEVLAQRGFNVLEGQGEARVYLMVDYIAEVRRIGTGGALGDPTYRALVVTAVEAASVHGPNDPPHVLWQTVVDSGGFSSSIQQTIPTLVSFGTRYYGKALTPRGLGRARWCADGGAPLGSRIHYACPARPGDPPPMPARPAL